MNHTTEIAGLRITETQNGWGRKGYLEVIRSNPLAQARTPRAGCTGPCPGSFQRCPRMETLQPLWAPSLAKKCIPVFRWNLPRHVFQGSWGTDRKNLKKEKKKKKGLLFLLSLNFSDYTDIRISQQNPYCIKQNIIKPYLSMFLSSRPEVQKSCHAHIEIKEQNLPWKLKFFISFN